MSNFLYKNKPAFVDYVNFDEHDEKIETKRLEHKQKMETDEAYRNAYKEKTRKAYEKAKERRLKKLETVTVEQPSELPKLPHLPQRPSNFEQPIEAVEPVDYSDLLYDF
jgi:hypothetical protein